MRLTTEFVCSMCGHATVHEVHYAGDVLHEIRCLECSNEIYGHHHPLAGYLRELGSRVLTKPRRLLVEVAKNPTATRSLPERILSKPLRMAREALEILR